MVLGAAVCFILFVGLLIGGMVWVAFRKMRYVQIVLPLVHCVAYFILLPHLLLLYGKKTTFAEQFFFPQAWGTLLAFCFLVPLSVLSAKIIFFIAAFARRLSESYAKTSHPDGDRPWQKFLDAPAADSKRAAFQEGFVAPRHGLSYLLDHPPLWRYATAPILLNILITIFAFILFIGVVIGLMTYFHPLYPVGWIGRMLEILCGTALVLLAMAAAAVFWMLMQEIFCSLYYGELARQVEFLLGTPPDTLKELPLGRQILDSFADVGILIVVNVALLLLYFIPVVGIVIAMLAGVYFNCDYMGRDYFNYPLGLRGLLRREKRVFWRKSRLQTLGLGTVVFLKNFIPVAGSILPVYCRRRQHSFAS